MVARLVWAGDKLSDPLAPVVILLGVGYLITLGVILWAFGWRPAKPHEAAKPEPEEPDEPVIVGEQPALPEPFYGFTKHP